MLEDVALEYVVKVRELLARESLSFRNVVSREVADRPGVYVIFNELGEIVYVGRTKNLHRRWLRISQG